MTVNNHTIKKIARKGNLDLYTCTKCEERALARDKEEAVRIYNAIKFCLPRILKFRKYKYEKIK